MAPVPAPAPGSSVIGSLFGPSSLDAAGASPWGTGGLPGLSVGFGLPSPSMPAPQATPPAPLAPPTVSLAAARWYYRDPQGTVQGPFTTKEMSDWFDAGYFQSNLPIRCETGPFTPLSTMFPNHDTAFTFIPELALPAPAAPQPSPQQLLALQSAMDELKLVTSQVAQLESEIDQLKKMGAEVGNLFNQSHLLFQQAQAGNLVDRAHQLQVVTNQYYQQLSQVHAEVNAKLKLHSQLKALMQPLETQIRQLRATMLTPSAPFHPLTSPVVVPSSDASPGVTSGAAAAAAAARAAEQQRAVAAAAAAEQQRLVEEQKRVAAAAEAARAAEQQRLALEKQQQQEAAAAAAAAALAQQQQQQREAKEKADREAAIASAKAAAAAAKQAAPSFAAIAQANVKDVPAPAPAPVPAPKAVAQPSDDDEDGADGSEPRVSLLEQQSVEAARKLGLRTQQQQPAAPVPEVQLRADPAQPSVWSASAAPKGSPTRSLAQIQACQFLSFPRR